MSARISVRAFSFSDKLIDSELTFAFLSDLHNYPAGPIFSALEAMKPDALLVGGDFIQSKTDRAPGLAFLRSAAARWPVFCSSGKEHDFEDPLIREIEATGAVFLRNQALIFRGISIGGLNTIPLANQPAEIRERLIASERAWLEQFGGAPGYKLLLCHHPEYYESTIGRRSFPFNCRPRFRRRLLLQKFSETSRSSTSDFGGSRGGWGENIKKDEEIQKNALAAKGDAENLLTGDDIIDKLRICACGRRRIRGCGRRRRKSTGPKEREHSETLWRSRRGS